MATTFDPVIRQSGSSMLIVCPHCTTSYDLKTAALGVEGRSVRCTRCQTVWHAAPPAMAVHGGSAEHDATDQTVAAFREALVGEPTQHERDGALDALTEAPAEQVFPKPFAEIAAQTGRQREIMRDQSSKTLVGISFGEFEREAKMSFGFGPRAARD